MNGLATTMSYPGDSDLTFPSRLFAGLLVGGQFLQEGLDEVVQTEALAVLQVLHHEVGETFNVSRGPAEVKELLHVKVDTAEKYMIFT